MERLSFWKLIDEARDGSGRDDEHFLELLHGSLGQLGEEDLFGFYENLGQVLDEAYRWDLWAASTIINGGGSMQDSFENFRAWLIAQGSLVFHEATTDPESLSKHVPVDPDWSAELEELLFLPVYVYETRTGREFPVSQEMEPVGEPLGERIDEEQLRTLFPRLRRQAGKRFG